MTERFSGNRIFCHVIFKNIFMGSYLLKPLFYSVFILLLGNFIEDQYIFKEKLFSIIIFKL